MISISKSVSKLWCDRSTFAPMLSTGVGSSSSSNGLMVSKEKNSHFWRNAIAIVMMPFIVIGVPVLSIVFDAEQIEEEQKKRHKTWIRRVLFHRYFNIINGICLVITVGLNVWLFYLFADLFNQFFIMGQLAERFGSTVRELFETFPVCLLVDFMWLRGSRLSVIVVAADQSCWRSQSHLQSHTSEKLRNTLVIAVTLVMCVLVQLLPYFSLAWKLESGMNLTTYYDYFTHQPYAIINTMILPLYIIFCGVSKKR